MRRAHRAPLLLVQAAFVVVFAAPAPAIGSAPDLFGHGARSASIARADVARGDPTDAPPGNPALAAAAGFRLRVGYGYGAMGLTLNGKDAGVADVSGVDFAAQLGASITRDVTLGLALSAHIPDASIASIAFRPATEPQFPLYEAGLERATADLVVALRYGPVTVGGGASLGLRVAGGGTTLDLTQDAAGTHADAAADVDLPYRLAPLVGVRVGLGRLALGATFRGAMAVDLRLESETRVALTENPLNGATTVIVSGASGYDPARIGVGAALSLPAGVVAYGALEVALYGAAPPPVADVSIDVRLGTVPSQREARFIEPRFRTTISPRLGLELRRPEPQGALKPPALPRGEIRSSERGGSSVASRKAPAAPAEPRDDDAEPAWRWAIRAGYVLAPSPVPRQTGFTSYTDATRHGIALGGGYQIGRVMGVDLSANIAAELHLLATRREQKPGGALPFASYEVGGHILHGAASLEAAWR